MYNDCNHTYVWHMVLMIPFFIYAFSSAAILPSCAVVIRTVNICILLVLVLIFVVVVTVTLTLLSSFIRNCLIIINTTLVVSLTCKRRYCIFRSITNTETTYLPFSFNTSRISPIINHSALNSIHSKRNKSLLYLSKNKISENRSIIYRLVMTALLKPRLTELDSFSFVALVTENGLTFITHGELDRSRNSSYHRQQSRSIDVSDYLKSPRLGRPGYRRQQFARPAKHRQKDRGRAGQRHGRRLRRRQYVRFFHLISLLNPFLSSLEPSRTIRFLPTRSSPRRHHGPSPEV